MELAEIKTLTWFNLEVPEVLSGRIPIPAASALRPSWAQHSRNCFGICIFNRYANAFACQERSWKEARERSDECKQTDFYAYLSGVLPVGLLLNAVLRWWWADPVAALI